MSPPFARPFCPVSIFVMRAQWTAFLVRCPLHRKAAFRSAGWGILSLTTQREKARFRRYVIVPEKLDRDRLCSFFSLGSRGLLGRCDWSADKALIAGV